MTRRVLPIAYRDPIVAYAPLRDAPMSMLLHGCGGHALARWSYILAEPTRLFDGAGILAAIADLPVRPSPAEAAPFSGGVAGFFGYEFGARLDPAMPQTAPTALPDAAFGHYDRLAAFDHHTRRACVIADDADQARRLAGALGDTLLPSATRGGGVDALEPSTRYQEHVRALTERIRAGDLFQANISRQFGGALGGDDHPYALFQRLCARSPAPFCAYMRLPHAAIVCNSPERLASAAPGPDGVLLSANPIKGTRPRGANAAEDAAFRKALTASEKDRAENLMIVDLMRNDFSRVCVPGTVKAPALFAVETYSNVHHLVSTVTGRMKTGRSNADLVRAIFPAGSITGAPKIKAMQLIREIEQAPREACYGSMAWFGADGAVDMNVMIRTAICTQRAAGWDVSFRVGGGIVIESDPLEEARETEVKALNLIRAIEGAP
ncbi:MAG TPA: anthranilate synthase component I family protein [Caulobacterales bacterium]|nr:anthranilate synthase component I family protein [Caulobacterales bacterium]